jgi:hypothetical protein
MDVDPKLNPELEADINAWTDRDTDARLLSRFPNAGFILHGSPDCSQYSVARRGAATPRNFVRADRMVKRYMSVVKHVESRGRLVQAYMENPSDKPGNESALSLRPFMLRRQTAFPRVNPASWIRHDVSYCAYHKKYPKQTNIWTRFDQAFAPRVCPGLMCWAKQQHSGGSSHEVMTKSTAGRGVIPPMLWCELLMGVVPLLVAYSGRANMTARVQAPPRVRAPAHIIRPQVAPRAQATPIIRPVGRAQRQTRSQVPRVVPRSSVPWYCVPPTAPNVQAPPSIQAAARAQAPLVPRVVRLARLAQRQADIQVPRFVPWSCVPFIIKPNTARSIAPPQCATVRKDKRKRN